MHAPIEHAAHAHHAHHPSALGIALGITAAVLAVAALRALLRRRFGPPGGRRALRWLFRRLDTSVSQEAEIRAALAQLRTELQTLRGSGRQARTTVAAAFRGEVLDPSTLSAAFDGPEAAVRTARGAVTEALARVHAVLSPEQRTVFAAMLERGPHPFARRRGCRHPAHP